MKLLLVTLARMWYGAIAGVLAKARDWWLVADEDDDIPRGMVPFPNYPDRDPEGCEHHFVFHTGLSSPEGWRCVFCDTPADFEPLVPHG